MIAGEDAESIAMAQSTSWMSLTLVASDKASSPMSESRSEPPREEIGNSRRRSTQIGNIAMP